MKKYKKLFELAKKQRSLAYAPYTNFHVGASLQTNNNKIFSGCNVENRSSSMTICAERNAIFKMIASGEKIPSIMLLTSDIIETVTYPCGACLQVITEFNPEMVIICTNADSSLIEKYFARELLPKC